ncbi:pseudouridine synthase [Aerococcus kribbianus]|uniref:Pseudouridine synthase n=1 Tax=Aerococcus kribbianus TaxID=2999064 RepID=A0A9X3FNB2_9LACT|nr:MULTISPECIES: pseudouridine synthase [unclassified Aerococcus]MCZ0717660.1 pseudouridine synthase [Aerococcus sp. YH-aer221]MCZ0725948.1 pseudouridine synthase [Aerococcus sp. YH-aer222]
MERLQKVIAHAGIASRRDAEKMITAGRVKVNGQLVTELGTKVSNDDRVEVDDVPIYKEEPVYFLFYKPTGVITAVSDDRHRPVVTDYFPEVEQRIYPIGRLDYNTSGLLLLTNDGEFANHLMHPRYEINKRYIAKVNGIPNKSDLAQLQKGVVIDGKKTARAKARLLDHNVKKQTAIVELIIHEGRNRQVRKMLETIGYPVDKLKREAYAFLELGNMQPGEWRPLLKKEVNRLLNISQDK